MERKRYTEKEKRALVIEFRKSGMTAKEFSKTHGLGAGNISRWNRKYRNTLIRKGREPVPKVIAKSLREDTTPRSRRGIIDAITDLLKYLE